MYYWYGSFSASCCSLLHLGRAYLLVHRNTQINPLWISQTVTMVQTSPWKDVLHAGTPPPMRPGIFAMATAFMGVAFYLVLEINLTVLRCFKRRRGLYFWSLLISAWGVFFHTIGYVLQWWIPMSPWILNTACILFGWSMMVTCQSLVLYSRLHLVVRDYNILRGVLISIITTAIVIEIPQWITTWASTDTKLSVTKLWSPYDSIMVRISQMAFLLQESALSLLYVWAAVKVLTPNGKIDVRRVKWDLLYINAYLILVDVIILVLAYTNEHIPKEPIQNFAYAFKLKIEFVVLNQLMSVTQQSQASNFNAGNRYVKSTWTDASRPVAISKPSSDGATLSPKQQYCLTSLAKGPTSPVTVERSQSESSGFNSEIKSPAGCHGKEKYFATEAHRSETGTKRGRRHDGVTLQEFHSSEALTPTNPEIGHGTTRPRGSPQLGLRSSPRSWWMQLISLIPTSEERL